MGIQYRVHLGSFLNETVKYHWRSIQLSENALHLTKKKINVAVLNEERTVVLLSVLKQTITLSLSLSLSPIEITVDQSKPFS